MAGSGWNAEEQPGQTGPDLLAEFSAQGLAAQQVEVKMEDRLARIDPTVADQAPTAGLDAMVRGDPRRHLGNSRGRLSRLWRQIGQSLTVEFWDDEQMDRRLGRDVFEGDQLLIFVH